jgi:hypothetical protein
MKPRVLVERDDWLTPRDGFARMTVRRRLLNLVYGTALCLLALAFVFTLGLTDIH